MDESTIGSASPTYSIAVFLVLFRTSLGQTRWAYLTRCSRTSTCQGPLEDPRPTSGEGRISVMSHRNVMSHRKLTPKE